MPEKDVWALFWLYKMEYILRGFALTEIENHDTVNIVRGNNSYTLFLVFSIDNLRRLYYINQIPNIRSETSGDLIMANNEDKKKALDAAICKVGEGFW